MSDTAMNYERIKLWMENDPEALEINCHPIIAGLVSDVDALRARIAELEAITRKGPLGYTLPLEVHRHIEELQAQVATIEAEERQAHEATRVHLDDIISDHEALTHDLEAERAAHEATRRELDAMQTDRDMWADSHEDDCPVVAERDQARRERDELAEKLRQMTMSRDALAKYDTGGLRAALLKAEAERDALSALAGERTSQRNMATLRAERAGAALQEMRAKTLEEARTVAVNALCDVPMCDDPLCEARRVSIVIRELHTTTLECGAETAGGSCSREGGHTGNHACERALNTGPSEGGEENADS